MPRRIARVVALSVTVAVGVLLLVIVAGACGGGDEGDEAKQTATAVQGTQVPTTPPAADQLTPAPLATDRQTPAAPAATATGDSAGGQGTPRPPARSTEEEEQARQETQEYQEEQAREATQEYQEQEEEQRRATEEYESREGDD